MTERFDNRPRLVFELNSQVADPPSWKPQSRLIWRAWDMASEWHTAGAETKIEDSQ